MASKISRKSWRWRGSSSSSAAACSSSLSATMRVLHEPAPLAEEHVLGPGTGRCPERRTGGPRGVLGGVGVACGPAAGGRRRHGPSGGRRPRPAARRVLALEVADDVRVGDRHLAVEHLAGRAVDGDDVALVDGLAVADGEPALAGVDVERLGAETQLRPCPAQRPPRARSCRRGWSARRARPSSRAGPRGAPCGPR